MSSRRGRGKLQMLALLGIALYLIIGYAIPNLVRVATFSDTDKVIAPNDAFTGGINEFLYNAGAVLMENRQYVLILVAIAIIVNLLMRSTPPAEFSTEDKQD